MKRPRLGSLLDKIKAPRRSSPVDLLKGVPSGALIVLDIGGTEGAGMRPVGSFGKAFVVSVNLTHTMPTIIQTDALALEGLPRPYCDGIFSSHMIEHIPYDQADQMFASWFEVLRPGGRLEIRCPDAEWTSKQFFLEGKITGIMYTEILLGKRVPGAAFYEWCHQNLWWYDKLAATLSRAGFVDVARPQGEVKYLDWWPYDLSEASQLGYPIVDLRILARKPVTT